MLSQCSRGVHCSGKGPLVVLFHSSLSSAKQWLPLVKQLRQCYRVLNVDLLGYGDAPTVSDDANYNFELELTRLKPLLGNQCYHLIGHSCGGALALKLAMANPARVLSLSLFEPVAFHLLEIGSEARKSADHFAEQVNITAPYLAATVFTDYWNKKGFFRALPERMQALLAQDMAKVNLDFKALVAERYQLADLNEIKAQCLMMQGQESPMLSRNLANSIAQALPACRNISFACGHMGPISHASIVQPSIADFIFQQTLEPA